MATSELSQTAEVTNFKLVFGTIAALSLIFQVGHFAEHAFQFGVWVLGDWSNICGRDTPWMSPWVMNLVDKVGLIVAPAADPARRTMLGMEVLHLIGNGIFLTGLVCLYVCLPSKWVRWALYIETFHLYEHIMLTTSAFFVGKPIGMSTLFGAAGVIGSRDFAVGFRVTWHFAMNLLPMPFAMIGIMGYERMRNALAERNSVGPFRGLRLVSARNSLEGEDPGPGR
ncbi:DUF6008 family protein [Mesorhizobium sp. ES1-6]|uniref:DUF6008 family protein n=1 Tax=Mesorhizobium sp. ES1-6 TaxID=2876626 RepID=UPI001CCA1389|nr:DUF6008 family protein [Mesorhizobium sp. ES1-6]MBZ9803447.1 hypothetical protein [Mesorhizobium sp. ES1-6]